MSGYQGFKLWLQSYLHLAKDALHVHVGLIVFLALMVHDLDAQLGHTF